MTDHLAVLEELDRRCIEGTPTSNAIRAAIALMRGQSEDMALVPRRLTYENGAKGALIGEFKVTARSTCEDCDGEGYDDSGDECESCEGECSVEYEIPIPWDTLKEIHKAMVAYFHPPKETAMQQTEKK
jgi:DnaJ-class molecular chaperone